MPRVSIRKKDKSLGASDVLQLVAEFIRDSETGRRRKKDGTRLAHGTIGNYSYLQKHLHGFDSKYPGKLKIYVEANLTQRERESARRYYTRFYENFSSYLYSLGLFDNYVGLIFKSYRTFFNYLHQDRSIPIGVYHKRFYVPKESIQIVALQPEQLKAIINDKAWQAKVEAAGLGNIRDIFIVGCTVALRVSDLLALRKSNLIKQGDSTYLHVKSKKTQVETRLQLPDYVLEIFRKHRSKGPYLLPRITPAWLNTQLKQMAILLDANNELIKTRERRGKRVVVYKDPVKRKHYTLADRISTHTMRRTAITTMLSMGMPEYMVRQVSGHAANSKEFFRYVRYIQDKLDEESSRVFNALSA